MIAAPLVSRGVPHNARLRATALAGNGHRHAAAGNPARALQCFQEALMFDPRCAEAHHGSALVAFGVHDFESARESARTAVRLRPRELAYLYTLGRALRALGQNDEAIKSYRHALSIDRSRIDVWLSLGIALRAQGDAQAAIDCYQRVLRISPRNWMAQHNLANALAGLGRFTEAREHYMALLAQQPGTGEVHLELGNLLWREGDRDGARHHYLDAVHRDFRSATNLMRLARALRLCDQSEAGLACLRKAIALEPGNSAARFSLADALYQTGDVDAAIHSYGLALTLNEDSAEGLVNLGAALRARGRRQEAMLCLERAIDIKPSLVEAHLNKGIVLSDFEQHTLAEEAFAKALALAPDMAAVPLNLGNVKRAQSQYSEAWRLTRDALALEPTSAQALNNLALLCVETGVANEALPYFLEALSRDREYARGRDNLLMALNYAEGDRPSDVFAAHREFDLMHARGLRMEKPAKVASDKLRVGYVSSDFRRHSVAYFAEPVLSGHDRSRFEVLCYHNHVIEDDVTARFKSHARTWVNCVGMSDEELAERIREDAVDILIDLNGHTGGNRLLTFARNPAPVQVSWLGYPGTTGLSSMDYRITDWQVDPRGYESYNSEKPLRLPGSYFCYRPPAEAPAVGPLPMLERGVVTFGSFNNLAKLSDATVQMWSRVLQSVQGSRLLLKTKALADDGVMAQVQERFVNAGIEAGRLELIGWEAHTAHHLEIYNRVDIALDTWPYNGATTTCEALWMGVPVVSLTGPMHASRMGLSILHAAGYPELSCADVDAVVSTALGLASSPERLSSLKTNLRPRLAASVLMNEADFVRAFESALSQSFYADA